MKKWYQKLSHPWAKSTAGFTLVELIVVIAIMGVLAGVGTVGYGAYVKSAQKKADQTLVSNIIRAIEVGTNSTMFVPPESLSVSATTYPVGFITLTSDGGKTLSSGATTTSVDGACVFSDLETVTYVKGTNKRYTCSKSDCSDTKAGMVYEKKTVKISYCTTHSKNQPAAGTGQEYNTGYKMLHEDGCAGNTHEMEPLAEKLKIEASDYFTADLDTLYEVSKDGVCELVANAGRTANTSTPTAIATDSSNLAQALTAAFGAGADFSLQYNGWGKDEDAMHDYESFYNSADTLFTKLDGQAQDLIDVVNGAGGLAELVGKDLSNYLTQGTYTDSAELMDSFAKFIVEKYTAKEWDDQWAAASTSTDDEFGFGIPSRGGMNDYIWAARTAFSNAFASYLDIHLVKDINGDPIDSTKKTAYINAIRDYGEVEYGFVNVPSVVNKGAFAKTGEGSLLEDFIGIDSTKGQAVFDQVKKLYEEKYVGSAACKNSGQTFYNTIMTMAETGGVAMDSNNASGGNYLEYYKTYLNEMADLYDKAQTEADNGIMIIVTMEDGQVKCQVSPSAADLRNSN